MSQCRWSWWLIFVLSFFATSPVSAQPADAPADAAEVEGTTGSGEVAEPPLEVDARSAITAVLERMDVELPRRLSTDDFALLEQRCQVPHAAWARCASEHGADDERCFDSDHALARCLVDVDDVTSLYLAIAADKKRIFGKDLYVEFAGLLAVLPMEAIEQARAACPQRDVGSAAECLVAHEVVGPVIEVYYALAREIVEESAKEAAEAGNAIDVDDYTDQVAQLLFRLPSGTILALAAQCMKLHPELEHTRSAEDIDRGLACIAEVGQTDPVANPAYISKEKLEAWLGVAREKVTSAIRSKETHTQDKNFDRILVVILLLTAGGYLVVLLLPLVLRRRYPGGGRTLWKASAVAAGTFAITVALLGASLLVTRSVQGTVAADSTSPKMRVADAAFAVLAKSETIEGLSELSKQRLDFIKAPLRQIVESENPGDTDRYAVFAAYLVTHWADLLDEPELKNIAKNVAMLSSHADSMRSVFAFYSKVDWLMGIVPILLSLLAVLLYLLPLKQMLVDVVTAPMRAASGSGTPDEASRRAMASVMAELKSTLPFLGVMLFLLPLTGFFLALAMEPLVELLIGYSLLTLFYILFAEASAFVIYACLGSAIVLLVVCLAAYITAMGAVLGQARKIFRAIFHLGYAFRDFKRFWIWSGVALLVMLALPFVYAYAAIWAAELALGDLSTLGAKELLLVPVPALLLFPVIFWAARGWKALGFIKKYPVPTTPRGSQTWRLDP